MRIRNRFCSAAIAAGMLAAPTNVCLAGQFKHGLGRGDSIKAQWPVPPLVRIGRQSIAIDVKDAVGPQVAVQQIGTTQPPDPTVPIAHLQAALDQAFGQCFTIVQSNGEALLRVAVVQYTPAEAVIQTVQQKVRRPVLNPDGTTVVDLQTGQPATAEHIIALEQWIARGRIAVRAEAVDSSGALIDGYATQASVAANQVVSVNGQDRLARTQLPGHAQVLAKLIADIAAQFQARYCPPADALDIPLAVDEELRPGNKLAKAGDFAAAAASWTAAQPTKPERESDRIHNLGAAFEAQAYGVLSKQTGLENVTQHLDRAAKHYADAVQLDPKEKYFTRAAERIGKAYRLVAELKSKEEIRRNTLAANRAPSPWPPGVASAIQPIAQPAAPVEVLAQPASSPAIATAAASEAPGGTPHDSPPEQAFRQLVRLRLRSETGAQGEPVPEQLEPSGAAYGLTAVQAKRIVQQEIGDWRTLQPKLAMYRESFTAFSRDGTITAPERDALNTLAKHLGLSQADMKDVETGAAQSSEARLK